MFGVCNYACAVLTHYDTRTHAHAYAHTLKTVKHAHDLRFNFHIVSVCSDTLKNEPGKSGSVKVYNYLLQQFPGENVN